jgi:fatty acid desaturase
MSGELTAVKDVGGPVAEWPTLGVAVLLYAGFGLLTWNHNALPWWVVLPLGGYLVCLHGSLQHEVVHGHPTRTAWLNEALVFPSLWLWLPFRLYRETHILHHRDEQLTCPLNDPESNYIMPETWVGMGPAAQLFRQILGTVAGRMLIGPAFFAGRLWWRELSRLWNGDRSHLPAWTRHIVSVALVLLWVHGVCGVPVLQYVLLYAYPGLSLTLLRSFCEHRAARQVGERTAIIEAGPVMSLLYLNNNLHAVHHAKPGTAWYKLPELLRTKRAEFLAGNGGYRFPGYWDILRRYLMLPKESPAHPFLGSTATLGAD